MYRTAVYNLFFHRIIACPHLVLNMPAFQVKLAHVLGKICPRFFMNLKADEMYRNRVLLILLLYVKMKTVQYLIFISFYGNFRIRNSLI